MLSSKLDVLSFSMKGIKSDIDDITEKIVTKKTGENKEQSLEVNTLFESFKTEMNGRFESLEAKLTKRVDDLVKEAVESINLSVSGKVSEIDRNVVRTNDENLRTCINSVRKFVSSEKLALRKFEKVTRKIITNTTDVFEGRIQNAEQFIALFANSSELRMMVVENKMFAFENASWKGERGGIGPAGQKGEMGQRGTQGEKGDHGNKGSVGSKGQKGEMGYKGNKGQAETRRSVYFSVFVKESKKISENTIVKFDHVMTNSGDGYNASTGIFTAPYSGPYLFLFFVRPDQNKFDIAYFKLYVDGGYRAHAIQQTAVDRQDTMGGQAYIEYMYAGEKAWIQTGSLTGDAVHSVHAFGTTFTGILIN